MKEIQFNGKTINVDVNMSTLITFEDITGHAFFGSTLDILKERVVLLYAAIHTADEKTEITIDDLLACNDWPTFSTACNVVLDMVAEFLAVPKVMAEEPKDEEHEKNSSAPTTSSQ